MNRIKTDLRKSDALLLDELAKAIGIQSRTEANSILINKCARHLIRWFSSDPHQSGCVDRQPTAPTAPPIYKVDTGTLPPLEF
jgi:hypothetical protein